MTMQGLGTSWMLPPKKKDDDAAYNQLIAQMRTLADVRPFMCPKSNGNPKKCDGCQGFRTCQAGQRAVRLMTEAEQMAQPKPEKLPMSVPTNPMQDMEDFKKACESGNAWNWLMTEYGMSEGTAREKLVYWIKRYPQIAQENGGRKRIMMKPRQVKILTEAPVAAQGAQEQASPVTDEQVQAEAEKGPEEAVNGPEKKRNMRDELNAQLAAQARERCRQTMESGDPVRVLMDEGKTEAQARNRITRWKKSYPDLFEDIDPETYRKKRGRKKKPEDAPEEPKTAEEPKEDDDISLQDFLKEVGATDYLLGINTEEEMELPEFDPDEADRREPEKAEENPATAALRKMMDERAKSMTALRNHVIEFESMMREYEKVLTENREKLRKLEAEQAAMQEAINVLERAGMA